MRERVGQVFRDQAQSEFRCCRAMKPNRRCRGLEGRHALGQQRRNKSGQDVTASARRKLRRRVAIDDRASIRGRDDGVRALEHDHGIGLPGRAAGALQLVALEMEKPLEFAGMGGQDARSGDRFKQLLRRLGE